MCAPVMAGIAVAGAGMSAFAPYQEGQMANKYYQSAADNNVQQANRVLSTSAKNQNLVQDAAKEQGKLQSAESSRTLAAQRVAMAASGIGAGSVTGEALALDSYNKAKMDEAAIRYNADAKTWAMQNEATDTAWALNTQADQYRLAGRNAKKSGNIKALTSLLGSASQYKGLLSGS